MLRKLTIATFVGAAALAITPFASADVLGVLTSGATPSASTWTVTHASVTGSSAYSRGAGLGAPASGAGYLSNSFSAATLGAAETANDYVTWGLVFNTAFDLDSFSIRYSRSATPGPTGGGPTSNTIQISINGGTFTTVHNDTSISTSGEDNLNIPLTTFDNVTSVTFRYYGYWNNGGTASATGTVQLQNGTGVNSPAASFKLQGTASVVPEPAIAGLLGLMALGLLRRRHA